MALLEPHSPELRMRWVGLVAAMGFLIDCMQSRGGMRTHHTSWPFPSPAGVGRQRHQLQTSAVCMVCLLSTLCLPRPRTTIRLCAQSAGALQVAGAQGSASPAKGGNPKWPCTLFGSVV